MPSFGNKWLIKGSINAVNFLQKSEDIINAPPKLFRKAVTAQQHRNDAKAAQRPFLPTHSQAAPDFYFAKYINRFCSICIMKHKKTIQ